MLNYLIFVFIKNIEKKGINFDDLRILYRNLNLILETEMSKLKKYIEEVKSDIKEKDNKLNEIVEKTSNKLLQYEFSECEINTMKEKVLAEGKKITLSTLNKIFSTNNPDSQITYIMKTIYDILKINTDIMEDNSINTSNNKNNNNKITWGFLKLNVNYKSILLLLSFISENSNITLSKEIFEEARPIITKYNHYKECYKHSFPEIITIIDFIKIIIEYYTKYILLKNLFVSNKNKNDKMVKIQSDLGKNHLLIQKIKSILEEIIKDYTALKKTKNNNNKIIYGYHILEKYSLYEKYKVGIENIYNYDEEYYNNYGGGYNNIAKKKYVISLNKKFRNREKFVEQLLSSLSSYSKGIRKINKEKFIQNIKDNKNNSLIKNNSNKNSLNKNNNSININNNNNNVLMRSIESNNSSAIANLYKSFQTNSFLNATRNNSTPYRSENSRNNIKGSFAGSYPTFEDFYQLSNRNISLKDGLNASSFDCSLRNNVGSREFNSLKNSMTKKGKKNVCFRNLIEKQINLRFENEQFSPCTFCCKTFKNKINDICEQ